jgi:UDPglucose 6-dehydrogenase
MQICVIGTGYVGLVTGACLAALGNQVTCVDNDGDKIKRLKTGEVIIYEPGLRELVIENMQKERLDFTVNIGWAIENASIIFITVNTLASSDGSSDLTQVFNVAKSIGNFINNNKQVIVKSTVPVGTCAETNELISKIQMERETCFPFEVAFNPEFLKEGSAVNDFMQPDRIVIGTDNEATIQLVTDLYSPITQKGNCPILIMDLQSAELTKYAANCMLAIRISFINELAKLCELTGADITQVSRGIGSDKRIGAHFLQAGLGYGGSCFSKDVKSLTATLAKYGLNTDLLKAVEQINQSQREHFINKIKAYYGTELSGKTLAVWGLTFKPETDDLREAPALTVIKELLSCGVKVKVFDPQWSNRKLQMPAEFDPAKLVFCRKQYEPLEAADALLIITEWECFQKPDFEKIKRFLKARVIFDGRNIYDPDIIREAGFQYYGVGRMWMGLNDKKPTIIR